MGKITIFARDYNDILSASLTLKVTSQCFGHHNVSIMIVFRSMESITIFRRLGIAINKDGITILCPQIMVVSRYFTRGGDNDDITIVFGIVIDILPQIAVVLSFISTHIHCIARIFFGGARNTSKY